MRILRAIYNRAVERGLIDEGHPFRHVFTGYEKTKKRAVSISVITNAAAFARVDFLLYIVSFLL